MLFSILGGEVIETSIGTLRKERVPVFADVYEAVACLGASYRYKHYLRDYSAEVDRVQMDVAAIDAIADGALADGRSFLLADEAQELMRIAGLPMPQSCIARNIDEAVRYAEEIGRWPQTIITGSGSASSGNRSSQ